VRDRLPVPGTTEYPMPGYHYYKTK